MNKQISIIGCGWLGFPLAKALMSADYKVKGSTTHEEKRALLTASGIDAFYVELTQNTIKGDIENCLSGSDTLVLNIPPGLRKHPETDYVKQMQFLISYIETSTIKNVLYIGSTSVFKDDETMPVITDETIPNADTESGKQLIEVEALLQKNPHFKTTVLRFGGLFGDDRHPANFLSGKTGLKNPDAPVNLIHREDCIGIIMTIIQNNVWKMTFNASTTDHPSRKTFYTAACKDLDLEKPSFESNGLNVGKLISSERLMQVLDYEFKIKLNN